MQSCPKCETLNRSTANFCKQCGTSLRSAPSTLMANRYRIVGHLGQGGMGSVYEAEDQRLGHRVVLKKEMQVNGQAKYQLLKNEKRLLAQLRHLALPRVIDYFTEGDGQYLVMEYVPGDNLDHLIKVRHAPFPMSQVLDWTGQLLNVLDYLHSRRPPIIHNDIKPANLRLTPENYLVLLDFGLATLKGEAVLGFTRRYAPLEQIGGRGTDERSDLYALGVTLYYLLTGTLPADALSRANAMNR